MQQYDDVLSNVSGMDNVFGWEPQTGSNDIFRAIGGLLGEPGSSYEKLVVRSRIPNDLASAMVIQQSKSFALLAAKKRENIRKFKNPIPSDFDYMAMPASQRALVLRTVMEMSGDGEGRYEMTSALTGGAFGRAKALAGKAMGAITGMGRRRANEKLAG